VDKGDEVVELTRSQPPRNQHGVEIQQRWQRDRPAKVDGDADRCRV
jgi:hypothetical protein